MKQNHKIEARQIWLNTVSGFLATVLGIVLTFGVARWQEKRESEQNKRDMTIMIIYDLEYTDVMINTQLSNWRELNERAQYVRRHRDAIDSIPMDTIQSARQILRIVMERNQLLYPEMAESIMKGNLDTWTTLNNIEFMTNVETCYSQRRKYNEFIVPSEVEEKAHAKFDEIFDLVIKEKGTKSNDELQRDLVRQLYATEEVQEYLDWFDWMIEKRNNIVAFIHKLNTENKWLMSVTDDDFGKYIEASGKRAPADRPKVTREGLIGTWLGDLDLQSKQYYLKLEELVLREDNSAEYIMYLDRTQDSRDSIQTHFCTRYGHWSLSGADLTVAFDSVSVSRTDYDGGGFDDWDSYLAAEKKQAGEGFKVRYYKDILLGPNDFSAMKRNDGEEEEILKRYFREVEEE